MGQGLALGCLTLGEDAGGSGRKLPPGVSQGEAPGAAVEEPRPQPLLKPGDGLGDGRLGKVELLGRGAEGAEFGDLGENRQGFEVW